MDRKGIAYCGLIEHHNFLYTDRTPELTRIEHHNLLSTDEHHNLLETDRAS